MWVLNDSKLDVSKGLAILRDPSIRKLSIANPEHAPYGKAAKQALERAGNILHRLRRTNHRTLPAAAHPFLAVYSELQFRGLVPGRTSRGG